MTGYRPLLAGIAIVALTVVVAVSLFVGRPAPVPKPGPSISAPPEPPGGTATASPGLPLIATSHVDGTFDTGLAHEPTASQAQSKLWFAEGTWWATLIDPATQELHIGRLDPATQRWSDTGTLVDDRPRVRSDALWDGSHLTIVSAGNKPTATQGLRLSQYHYDARSARFAIDPDLPIALTAVGVSDPVLAKDSKGILWLAYVDKTRLILRHSAGDAWHWSPAAMPSIAGADGATRTAGLSADGSRVTLVWNRVDDDTLRVGQHVDGADPGTWVADSTRVTGLANAPGGLSVRAIATVGGSRLFIAFELAPDQGPNANPLAPGAALMIREADGAWANVQLARAKDHFATPVLAIDDRASILIAVASVSSSGTIVYKQSPLERVSFESGTGTDLIASSTDPNLRNPTSTKQAVDLSIGLVVLSADDGTGHYASGRLSTTAALPSVSPSPAGSPPPGPARGSAILLHDTFAPWAVGTRLPAEWATSAVGRGTGLVEVVGAPGPHGRSLLVRTTSILGSVRACTSFAPSVTPITVIESFQLAGVGTSDTTVGSLRGPGGEAASVRVTKHHLLAFYDGSRKVTSAIVVSSGVLYRSTIVADPVSHTYSWTLANAAGRATARFTAIHWRQAAIPALDTVCAQSPQGRGGAILLDDLEVRR